MNAVAFFKEIRGGAPQRVYLLHGVEEYAKDRAIEALLESLDPELRDFNVAVMNDPSVHEIIAACESLPMMADFRVNIVRESRYIAQSDGDVKELIAYLQDIPETSCLAFVVRGECDSRRALFKAVSKLGGAVAFERYSEDEAARWASSYAARRGGNLPLQQARRLVSMVGRDLSDVANETEKVCDYACGAQITDEIIERCVRKNLEYTVFQMLEHFLAGRLGEGFEMLYEELRGADAAIPVLMFFASRIRNMLSARYALDDGASIQEAAKAVEGNAYAAKKSVEAASKFTTERLEEALITLADADFAIKRGRITQDAALIDALIKIFSVC